MQNAGRRLFLIGGLGVAAIGLGLEYRWMARRALIRAGVKRPPANLLRNAGFLACTNGHLPDYWGTNAAAVLGDMTEHLRFSPKGAVAGSGALRVANPRPSYQLTMFGCHTFVPKPVVYTLSAYLRAETEDQAVGLQLGWGKARDFTIGRVWKRVQVSYVPSVEAAHPYGLETRFLLTGPGSFWLSGPQLEVGSTATDFDLALMDDHPLPEIPLSDDWARSPGERVRSRTLEEREGSKTRMLLFLDQPRDDAFAEITAVGIDAVVMSLPAGDSTASSDSVAQATHWLDLAHARGLRVVGGPVVPRGASVSEILKHLLATVRSFKSHPALTAWLYFDEPSMRWPSPPWNQLKELRDAIRNEDPAHPAFLNDNRWPTEPSSGRTGPLSASDFGSVDIYPIGQYTNSLLAFAETSARLNASCELAGKPSCLWMQLYGWHDAVREPTPEELRAMVYATYIHGTRLLGFFIYRPSSQTLWRSLVPLRREISRLDTITGSADAQLFQWGTRSGRVHYAVWTTSGQRHLIACNVSPEVVWTWFDASHLGTAPANRRTRWFDGTTEAGLAGRLWVSMPGYARQVFSFNERS